MIRYTNYEDDKTYPFITPIGILEITPSEFDNISSKTTMNLLICKAIRDTIIRSGRNSSRWDSLKERIYVIINGEFQLNEANRTKRKKYMSIDLLLFKYEELNDVELLEVYEYVIIRSCQFM